MQPLDLQHSNNPVEAPTQDRRSFLACLSLGGMILGAGPPAMQKEERGKSFLPDSHRVKRIAEVFTPRSRHWQTDAVTLCRFLSGATTMLRPTGILQGKKFWNYFTTSHQRSRPPRRWWAAGNTPITSRKRFSSRPLLGFAFQLTYSSPKAGRG